MLGVERDLGNTGRKGGGKQSPLQEETADEEGAPEPRRAVLTRVNSALHHCRTGQEERGCDESEGEPWTLKAGKFETREGSPSLFLPRMLEAGKLVLAKK